MKMTWCALAMGLVMAGTAAADPKPLDAAAMRLLREAGAVSYARQAPYGGGIAALYLGYNAAGEAVIGVAAKETKTYRKALTLIAVEPADGKFKIRAAEIPDLAEFHGKSQDLARGALKNIAGRVLADEAEARGLVDAVTGATKYLEAIYVSYSYLAGKVIAELKAGPAWERQPLPTP